MLRIKLSKEIEPKTLKILARCEARMRLLLKRTHNWDVGHRTHNLHKPIKPRKLGVRETTMCKVTSKFQSMICNLNTRPETLLPLIRVSAHQRIVSYLFPHAVTLWVVPAGRKEPRRQMMHLTLLDNPVPKNPAICEDKHVLDALRTQ